VWEAWVLSPTPMIMSHQTLYWDTSYEIVQALMEAYPNTIVDSVGIEQLLEMIVTLPTFADDPILANEDLLTDILREWYEESNS